MFSNQSVYRQTTAIAILFFLFLQNLLFITPIQAAAAPHPGIPQAEKVVNTASLIDIPVTAAFEQKFDTIGITATATLPTEFKADRVSTVRRVGTYSAASTATTAAGGASLSSSAANGIYNFGSGTTTTGADRAVGFLSSGTGTQSGNLYTLLTNNTDAGLNGLEISYDIEKYRGGSNPAGFRIQLFYSTDGVNWTSAGDDFLTSFAPDAGNTGFATAPGATEKVLNKTLGVSIPASGNFYLAWNYSVSSGTTVTNAQALAIDNISIKGIASTASTPTPTPTATPTATPTPTPTNPAGVGTANPNSVLPGGTTLLSVTVTPGTNPTSTSVFVAADLTTIGGAPVQPFSGSGNTFTFQTIVAAGTSPGTKTLPVTITDAEGRTSNASINLTVDAPPPPLNHIVISQVYGGGGNGGATYQNDFIELFNPDTVSHNLSGWTIQYASDTGTNWQVQPLGGTMAPGEYYLIKLGTNGAVGAVVPEANINGNLNLSGTNGKVALVRNGDALNGCVVGEPVVDFVGYGSSANCREGTSNAPAPSNTSSIFRKDGGFTDTNVNGADFVTGTPNPNRRTTPIVELPPTTLNSDPRKNGTNTPRDASITVNFTEPVDITDGWFSISCVITGPHNSATVASGGANSWIIIPNVNFKPGEQCTLTVNKEFVHDSDLDDALPNTDQLTSNYVATFTVATGDDPAYPSDVHLAFGNPSGATADINEPNNYLMVKPEFTLSYNRDRGIPNWVSWHLADEWIGSLARVDTFRADPAVPADWYRVTHVDYASSGFDRGHMVPNADRDPATSSPINQATFLMTNMIPQAPDNNQGPWANLENYLRTLLPANEIYIVAGGSGTGGTGSNGSKTTIANGKVTVPARTWKVALVIPKQNGDDVSRVNASARTIAVNMPNIQGIRTNPNNPNDWQNYLVSIDQVEALTGYDFFSNLPDAVENSIEAGINGANPPGTESFSVSTVEDTSKSITLNAVSPNNNPLTFTIVNSPAHGTLTGTGADRVYTPASDFVGTDSFSFRASDGSKNSNISTVTITVTEFNESPVAGNDEKSTQEDSQLVFNASELLANDSPGDSNEVGQTLNVTNVATTANTRGTVTYSSGQITYIPDANYNGSAGFNYQVCDNGTTNGTADAKCTTGVVNVTINPVNDAPTAITDSAATNEDTPVVINVRGNDSDVDGDQLSITNVSAPSKGTGVVTADGKILYTPNPNQNGADSFTYAISDGQGGTATATVNVLINPVNDAPTLAPISNKTVVLGNTISLTAVASDIDLPAQSLTFGFVGEVPAGAAINSATGDFSWTPTQAQVGKIYTFTIRVTDSGNLSSDQSFTVAVAYEWSDFLSPINPTGENSFNAGRTIPVKFKLTGASQGIGNATAKLWLAKVVNNVPGAEVPAESNGNSNTGNLFHHEGNGQYIFNLSTKDLSTGTYQLRVDLGDGVLRTVLITLR
jgi:endonuclease G